MAKKATPKTDAKAAPKKGAKKSKKGEAKAPPKPRPLALVIPKTVGVFSDRVKNKWTPGQKKTDQEIGGDGDGDPIDRWIKANADKAGKSEADWLAGATKNIRAHGGWMADVPDLKSGTDVKGLLDGIYAQGDRTGEDVYNTKIWPMWKAAGAKHDSPWQYKTSLRAYTGKTEQERIYDLSQKSWVDTEAPIMQYVDPNTFPYVVRNDAPVGSIFKITYVDTNKVTHSTYAMVADHGTNRAEMSQASLNNLGIKGSPNGISSPGTVSLEYLGMGDLSSMPTAATVARDGAKLEKELEAERAKKKDAAPKKPPGKKKTADAQKQGGAYYLAEVSDHGVMAGVNQLLVAVADPTCLHSGGEAVVTGSRGIFVGKAKSPLAGEGDKTNDALAIKKGTGDQTIIMT